MSFTIEDENVYLKSEIWNKIKKLLNTRFHSQLIYDDKYIKTKVKTFSGLINTLFSDNEIPKERNNYFSIYVSWFTVSWFTTRKSLITCLLL